MPETGFRCKVNNARVRIYQFLSTYYKHHGAVLADRLAFWAVIVELWGQALCEKVASITAYRAFAFMDTIKTLEHLRCVDFVADAERSSHDAGGVNNLSNLAPYELRYYYTIYT